ncbi:hypothetical protein [Parendozoicomonas haliclonae]|uniref:Uncharacterized protein n=1 Tax=Parendozoicomonas haliclonae TaxID=1960125 RepID=A0A1X7AQ77_9GAMM|nr:hypothetical protein [Parendozoicomonas haliclonae]SMA50464.1 hypothetical protein EHSB41UT_04275 [Parendozoicomonas haliclonae]
MQFSSNSYRANNQLSHESQEMEELLLALATTNRTLCKSESPRVPDSQEESELSYVLSEN